MARKRKTSYDEIEEEKLDDELEKDIKSWNKGEDEKLDVATIKQADYNNTVRLVNKIGARVTLHGKATGQLYRWERSGAVVEVDERDAPELLEKTLGGKRCCGSANKNYVFGIYKE